MTTTWTWSQALAGVVPPLISPLGDGGDADAGAMAALVEHVVAGGCTGLFVLGGCGEGAWLTTAQRDAIVRAAVKAAAGRAPVLAAVMLPATGPAVEAARRARGEGADAVVVGSPYYFAVDGGGHRRHVEAVLEAAGLPGLLYNIPQCTHAVLAADTVAALARDARVLGMKDSAGDFLTFQRYLTVKRERPEFRVLQGQEALLAASVLHGGDGAVPGVANIAPRLCVDLVRAAHAKDSARATQLQEQVTGLTRVYEQGNHWLSALKGACAQLGLGNGRPAPPLEPAGDAARAAIAALLSRLP